MAHIKSLSGALVITAVFLGSISPALAAPVLPGRTTSLSGSDTPVLPPPTPTPPPNPNPPVPPLPHPTPTPPPAPATCKLTQQRVSPFNPNTVRITWETTQATRVEWMPSLGQAYFGLPVRTALPAQGSMTVTIPRNSELVLIMGVTNTAGSATCSTRLVFAPIPVGPIPAR